MKKFILVLMIALGANAFAASKTGSFTDDRDGKTYKTIKIGEQIWFSQNVNFEVDSSWCYANKAANCKAYGRLYSWDAAQKACPSGWRLPSNGDFQALFEKLGGAGGAATKLKTKEGWYGAVINYDSYGFHALPSGSRNTEGTFYDLKKGTSFWTSTAVESYSAYKAFIYFDAYAVPMPEAHKDFGHSVRCMKDAEKVEE